MHVDKRTTLAAALLAGVVLLSGMPGSAAGSKRPPADDKNNPPAPRHEVRPDPPPIEAKPVPPEPAIPQGPTPSESLRTATGITAEQAAQYLALGNTLDDIMRADAIAAQHGQSVSDLLAVRRSGKNWGQIISDLVRSGQGAPRAGNPTEALIQAVAATTGLTVDEVNRYLAKGFTADDLTNAHFLAERHGLSLNAMLARKRNRTWSEVDGDLNKEPAQVPEIAKASGFTPPEIKALLEEGYSLADVRQAAMIAKAAGMRIAEVLALRGSRDWLEVAMELRPTDKPPVLTDKPTGKGGN